MDVLVPLDILDHNFSRIFPVTKEISDVLTYKTQMFNRATKRMKFGSECLIDDNGIFMTGLVPHLKQSLPHLTFDVKDQRQFPEFQVHVPDIRDHRTGEPLTWREYQIDYLIRAVKESRMIFDSETGSGKTIMIASVIGCYRLPTLLIAPNLSVLRQLQGDLSVQIPDLTFATTADKDWEESDFLIGLSRTLSKFDSSFLKKFKLVLVDEAHTAAAQQTMDVILNTGAPYRYGFTADSKGRSDNRDMVVWGLLGEPIKLIDRKELEELKYSPTVVTELHRGWFEGDHHVLEDLLIVNNPKRNALIAKIVKNHPNCTILVLVTRVEHGKILEQMIPSSLFIWGATDDKEREEVRQKMISGKIRILIASKVFALGIDIPNIEVGINAAGGKAEILTGQRIGRIMRTWHDVVKKWIDIYDDYHDKLALHSKHRLAVYKRKQTNVRFIGFPKGLEESLERLDPEKFDGSDE